MVLRRSTAIECGSKIRTPPRQARAQVQIPRPSSIPKCNRFLLLNIDWFLTTRAQMTASESDKVPPQVQRDLHKMRCEPPTQLPSRCLGPSMSIPTGAPSLSTKALPSKCIARLLSPVVVPASRSPVWPVETQHFTGRPAESLVKSTLLPRTLPKTSRRRFRRPITVAKRALTKKQSVKMTLKTVKVTMKTYRTCPKPTLCFFTHY